jgi:S-adenosylmethionine hydrolase
MLGGALRVVELTNTDYQLESPGPTFAGRDILAPAAAYLASGTPVEDLGTVIDPFSLVPGLIPLPQTEGGALSGEVLWVDRFGNLQLNLDPGELESLGLRPGALVEVRVAGSERRAARWVTTYADAKPSELMVVVDSYGLVSLAFDRRSAAEALGISAGTGVTLSAGS